MNQTQAMQAYLSQGIFDSTFNSTSAATTGIGRLSAEDANAFINFIVDQSILKQAATVYPMNTPQRRVSFIGINDDVLKPGVACTDPGVTAQANVAEVVLTPQLMKAEAKICDEELEDNLERDALRADFMGLLTRKIANRLEQAFLIGKKTTGTPVSIFQQVNGWITTALASGHVIDGSSLGDGASGANTRYVTTAKLKKALKAIPSKYFETPDDERFFASRGVYLDFGDLVGNRLTPLGDTAFRGTPSGGGTLGDGRVRGVTDFGYLGYNMFRVPLMPENAFVQKISGGFSSTLSAGAAVGAGVVTLASVTGLTVGDNLKIAGNASDAGQDEYFAVTAIDTTAKTATLNGTLLYAHSSGNAAVNGSGDGTFILATNVQNLAVGIRRDITIEWDRRPRESAWYVIVTMRVDSAMINPDAAAVVTNVASA